MSWALYDWANSPFTTLVITFVFPAYFSQAIVGNEIEGTKLWGYTTSISALIIAIGSPILGAIADAGGPRKPWLFIFTAICVVGSWMLWYAYPTVDSIFWVMLWVILANIGFELGIVFNNAMLPDLAATSRLGRWSGWSWGLGYIGGLAALVVTLLFFVQAENPLFDLSKENQDLEHIRVVGPFVAIWFVIFVWPMIVFTRDRPRLMTGIGRQISRGLSNLWKTLKKTREYRNILRFLIARMIYADGLTTIFVFGGIYAAGTFGMELDQVIKFGIILNVTAGVGAFIFAWLDDWFGSKIVIYIGLCGLFVTCLACAVVSDLSWFWIWGSLLGIFVGPTQAASRSLMSRLSPADLRTEFFGLYALTGKATAFVGPAIVAFVVDFTGSQRLGLSTVLGFFVVGFILLLTVKETRD